MNIGLDTLVGVASILGSVTSMFLYVVKRANSVVQYVESEKQFHKHLRENMTDIQRTLNKIIESDNIQSEGLQCVLREHLLESMEKSIHKGYADDHVRENVEKMFKAYRGLGGNGVVKSIHEQFAALKPWGENALKNK